MSSESSIPAPFVSVVLPAYNVAGYIAAALDSVFAQTFRDFEVIVVNDGSPDTAELELVIAPYRERIHYIVRENGGVAAARNTAVRASRGEWIAALDPDDLWDPGYLQNQVDFIQANPQFDLVYADAVIFGDTPDAGKTMMTLFPSRGEVTFERLVTQECAVFHCASLVRRRAVVESGYFDESFDTGEDFDLWLRAIKRGHRFGYHHAALARYRRRGGSLTADNLRTDANALRVCEKAATTLDLEPSERSTLERRQRALSARIHFMRARQSVGKRDAAAARHHFNESHRLSRDLRFRLLGVLLGIMPGITTRLLYFLWPAARGPAQAAAAADGSLTERASWLLFARTAAFGFNILLPLLVVRKLDQHAFGLYKQVFLVIQTCVALLPLGYGMTAYYFLPREQQRRREVVFNIMLVLSGVAALACAVMTLYPSLLVILFKERELLGYAPWIGVVTALWIVGAFLEMVPIANQETKLATVAILTIQIVRTILLLVAAAVWGSVQALIWAAILQGVFQLVILMGYLISRFGAFWSHFDARMFRSQLSYALPLGFIGILWIFQTDLHNYFISNRFGAIGFAIYSIGCFQLPLMGLLGEAAASVLIPQISALQKAGDNEEIISITLRATRKLAAVAFALYALLMVVAPEFIVFLFTPRYRESVPIFMVNLTLVPFTTILVDPLVRAFAEYRYTLVKIRVCLGVLLAAGLWWVTGHYGLVAAIGVVVGIGILDRTAIVVLFIRVLGFHRRHLRGLRDVAILAFVAIAAAGITAVTRHFLLGSRPLLILAVCAAVFGLVYVAGALTLRAIRLDEVAFLWRMVRNRLPSRSKPAVTVG